MISRFPSFSVYAFNALCKRLPNYGALAGSSWYLDKKLRENVVVTYDEVTKTHYNDDLALDLSLLEQNYTSGTRLGWRTEQSELFEPNREKMEAKETLALFRGLSEKDMLAISIEKNYSVLVKDMKQLTTTDVGKKQQLFTEKIAAMVAVH